MSIFVRITVVMLFSLRFGESLQESAVSEDSGSSYRESNSLLQIRNNLTVLYYDNETIDSNRLYIYNKNFLGRDNLFKLYNTLSRFTHTNDHEVVKYEGLPFVVNGIFIVNSNLSVYFTVLMTEKKAQLIQNRIRAEFEQNNSIIDQEYRYMISPGIFLAFDLLELSRTYLYMLVITFQDYLRIKKYGPYIVNTYYTIGAFSITITIPENILILTSILKYKNLQTPPNVYVLNLAVADILLLASQFCLAIAGILVRQYVNQNNFPYLFITEYIMPSFWYFICWNAVGITIDRYIAICHPFLGRRISTYSRAVKVNIAIWILALITSFIKVMVEKLYSFVQPDFESQQIFSSILSLMLFIVLPMCIILPAYFCIALSIWKSSKMRQSRSTNEQPVANKSIKIAAVVAVQYLFFWAPVAGSAIISKILNLNKHAFMYTLMFIVTLGLITLGSMFNPVLYALLSKDFRKAFKDLGLICYGRICRLLCCGKSVTPVENNIALN